MKTDSLVTARSMLSLTLGAAALTGCVTQANYSHDKTQPTLAVLTPERGTTSDVTELTVTGNAGDDDSGVASLTINDTPVKLNNDGSFSATVQVAEGVQLLRTVVTDRAGNKAADTRAVMAGPLANAADPLTNAVIAKIDTSALTALGKMVGTQVDALDLTAAVGANALLSESGGSCLGYKATLQSITKGASTFAMVPSTGKLGTAVTVANLDVKVKVNFKAACIGGSSTVRIRATMTNLNGDLALSATAGQLAAAVDNLDIAFENFDVDASGVPGAVVNLFQNKVNDAVTKAVRDAVRKSVPGMVQNALADYSGRSFEKTVLGEKLKVGVTTDSLSIDGNGIFLSLGGKVSATNGMGAQYVASPMPASAALMNSAGNIGLGVADDFLNQLFAGVWATGSLDLKLPFGTQIPAALFFGDTADHATIKLLLPPSASTDASGALVLTVGDALISVEDAQGGSLASFAVSLTLPLSAQADAAGKVGLTVGKPGVAAQVLSQSADLPRPVTEELIVSLAELAATQLSTATNTTLQVIPVPMQNNIKNLAIKGSAGYLMVGADLTP
jgi:hypothetical protein